ncbi:aldo/keto reductase [Microbacterium sp. P26]|nr:aldo/keto reductase [Microbacterium sp. P26]
MTEQALEAGYRHLDTAAVYRNERAVGAAIVASGIPRDEIFVTTKVWNDAHGSTATRDAFARSLDLLQLDVVDLLLIHWPVPTRGLYRQAWGALQRIHDEGGARAIGVSNFLIDHLEHVLADGGVRPAVNQIEVHPANHEAELAAFCASHGIAIEAYSPLARGRATDLPAVAVVAERLGRSIPQVILAWHLHSGRIVLPKTVTPARMRENLDVLDIVLSGEDMAVFDGLDSADRIGADPRTFEG